MALAAFQPATQRWFAETFGAPTAVQLAGWPPITDGQHTLLLAPTGSGKTLAAFLACLDRLGAAPAGRPAGVRVVYVSPLKALAYDVERNLSAPLAGIARVAAAMGVGFNAPRIAVRTGDTPPAARREMLRRPAEILITTPESLYLMLGSSARETLRLCDTIIVDEIHALAPTKRGAHLALSLERLSALCARDPQRIGLSATQRPLDEVGRFLAGDRPVALIDSAERPRIDLAIEVPVDDMEAVRAAAARQQGDTDRDGAAQGIWAAIHPRLLELVRAHGSTIIFTNSRRLCERLAQSLNELAAADGDTAPLVRAHHGSVARAQREEIELLLKTGALRGLCATSSLELGIDMSAVDLVIQIESPGTAARGLQRIGRAGHSVGARSSGRIFPKHRGDLLEATVVAQRMAAGAVEPIRVPQNTLDVLAQQIVAMVSVDPWPLAALETLVRRAYGFSSLSRPLLVAVLEMLSGHYPSDAFADLRPRIVWDRGSDVLTGRRDAKIVALVNGGTIPDRGLYGVHLGADGPRIGELDEEMVHESRVGETFLLGASTWRIEEITRDRVVVQPAPGEPGKMPFWRGEGPGRPLEVGRALGEMVRTLGAMDQAAAVAWLTTEHPLEARAAANLWRYVNAQKEATGTLPSDRAITIERFRDELGDWRVCLLSPFGARVHAPWALALQARLAATAGFEIQTLWSDDGIALRFADADQPPPASAFVLEPEEIDDLLVAELARSALFATHFRENAARALLLPRRRPNMRTPLWTQRLKAQTLMAAAMRHPDFPIVLETYRECLNDVFDVPALVALLTAIRRREVRVVEAETPSASPFARSLAFAYVAAYMYEGDAPLAERKAQALTLDRNLLRDLLGQEELAELLEPTVIDAVAAELQALEPERLARHADALHDLLRRIGDLDGEELAARATDDPRPWLQQLQASGRALAVTVAGQPRFIAAEDAGRYRDGLGVAPPPQTPAGFLAPVADALTSLVARFGRTHGPFVADDVANRFGIDGAVIAPIVRALAASGQWVQGPFRAGHSGAPVWCDAEVLRLLRRRTLAHLRNQVAPVGAEALARFLPRWHGLSARRTGIDRLREAVQQLEGLYLPFADLEQWILPARVEGFTGAALDGLGALGDVVWVGRREGVGSGSDGRIALFRRDRIRTLADGPALPDDAPALPRSILDQLTTTGASFFSQLQQTCATATSDEILAALWELVWAGLVTNDTFQPLRAASAARRGRHRPTKAVRPSTAQMAGRWSAVATLLRPPLPDTQRAHARAQMLLDRYGVVSREAAGAEDLPGGFSPLAQVLRAMEDAGKIRRGYFVEGLTGAQFALPGAVDRLRDARDASEEDAPVLALAAVDPANPYGLLLPWPTAESAEGEAASDAAPPRRAAGTRIVLVSGRLVFFVDRGGRSLRVFSDDPAIIAAGVAGLRQVAQRRRPRGLRIETVDGTPALRSPLLPALRAGGFRAEPGAIVLDDVSRGSDQRSNI
ncbi:MAG TPA: DEAD/DEAH box helicase [Polyangia bacterium]|nr:DEAD/DEAH box helicase [Polyangia bacterium]